MDKQVGQRLRDRRTGVGLSVDQLAARSGCKPREIEAFEAGEQRLGAQKMFELCSVLGVDVSYFFH